MCQRPSVEAEAAAPGYPARVSAARPFGDDPSARARSGHKRATIARLEEAFRAGQLTTPDHDLRVSQAESALTVGELEALLRDLEPPYGASVLSADTLMPTPQGPPAGSDGAAAAGLTSSGLTSSGSRTAFGFILVAALLVMGLGVAVFAMTSVGRQATQGSASGTPQEAPADFVLGERSVDRFLRELDRSADGLDVVSALFFADHVVVEVPGGDGGAQLVSYNRPGQLVSLGEAPRSSPTTVDLARLDVGALVRNFRKAPARVHLQGRVDVIATVSRQTRQGPATVVYAVTNAGGRYGYVITDLAGRVTSVGRADG